MKTIPRIHWKHKTKTGDEYCAMCEKCGNVLYHSVNYIDYYCSQCGKKVNWKDFIEKYKDNPDTNDWIKAFTEGIEKGE